MAQCLADSLLSGRDSKLASRNTTEQGREKDRKKEWHSWHYGRWFKEPNTRLASANVITMMRWWGNPSVFPSVVCLCTCVCVCVWFWSYTRVCITPVSPVIWRIYHVYVWVLCLDWVVIVFQTCGIFTAEWFTPTSICCLPLLIEVWLTPHNWPTRTDQIWPDLTTPLKINQRQQDWTNPLLQTTPITTTFLWLQTLPVYQPRALVNWDFAFCSNLQTHPKGLNLCSDAFL